MSNVVLIDAKRVVLQRWAGHTLDEIAAERGSDVGLVEVNAIPGQIVNEDGSVSNPPSDLDGLKEQAIEAIIQKANGFTDPILGKYPEAEQRGWPRREAEARAIVAADDKAAAIAETIIIKGLANRASEDANATIARAERIIAKADELATISVAVETMRTSAIAAVMEITDPATIPDTLAALEIEANALAAEFGLA